MATYEISDPSGAVYHVDAPDDASQADVLSFMQQNKHLAGDAPQDMGRGAAAVQGFNATVPFGEKITAGLGAVGAKTYDKVTGGGLTDDKTIGQLYDEGRADQAATRDNHKGAYIGGVAAGIIPSMLLGGAAADATGLSKLSSLATVAPAAKNASTLAKAGVLAGNMALSGAKAAPVGAVYGAGAAEPGQMVEGAEHGAKVAAVLGAAAPVVSAGFNAAKDAIGSRTSDFLQELTTPRAVGGVRKELAANATEEGMLNSYTEQPTTYQQQVMKTIADTGVRKGASNLANRETIEGALGDEANTLRQNIAGSKVIYTPQDMAGRIQTATQAALQDDPLLVGDGERYLEIASNKMNGLVQANKGTPEGLLDARQQFDQWAKSKSGFGDKDTAFRTAVSTVRGVANKYLGDMVPTAAVKDSLTKQSHMYDAIDALNSKIAYDPTNSVSRFLSTPTGKAVKYGAGLAGADMAVHKIGDMLSSKKDDDE